VVDAAPASDGGIESSDAEAGVAVAEMTMCTLCRAGSLVGGLVSVAGTSSRRSGARATEETFSAALRCTVLNGTSVCLIGGVTP